MDSDIGAASERADRRADVPDGDPRQRRGAARPRDVYIAHGPIRRVRHRPQHGRYDWIIPRWYRTADGPVTIHSRRFVCGEDCCNDLRTGRRGENLTGRGWRQRRRNRAGGCCCWAGHGDGACGWAGCGGRDRCGWAGGWAEGWAEGRAAEIN